MRVLFIVSWVLLTLVAALLLLGSIGSLANAYTGGADQITPSYELGALAATNPEAATAIRARRATAAAWALGYALLMAAVVLIPYRRGEVWAWGALLVAALVAQGLSALRFTILPGAQGTGVAVTFALAVLVALLIGAPYVFGRREAAATRD